jgi:hypothetical protein
MAQYLYMADVNVPPADGSLQFIQESPHVRIFL